MIIEQAPAADVTDVLTARWGDTVAVHGTGYRLAELDALVARDEDGTTRGVLTYTLGDGGLEVVTVDAIPPGEGIGAALVRAAVELARERGLTRAWATTTNDNLDALGFWQAQGFTLAALRPRAVTLARRITPTVLEHGARGLPVRDELDLELTWGGAGAERFEARRVVAAPPAAVFGVLTDPAGHVRIDSAGMLQSADGERVAAVGDRFVVHMDREALGDLPMGRYDVTVVITAYTEDEHLEWTIEGTIKPPLRHLYGYRLEPVDGGTLVTSYYDWSAIDEKWRRSGVFPVIQEASIRATLGILARVVENG